MTKYRWLDIRLPKRLVIRWINSCVKFFVIILCTYIVGVFVMRLLENVIIPFLNYLLDCDRYLGEIFVIFLISICAATLNLIVDVLSRKLG